MMNFGFTLFDAKRKERKRTELERHGVKVLSSIKG